MSQAFFLPTRVFSGDDCVKTHAAALWGLGTKALIVTGRNSARATGAGADVEAALRSLGRPFVVYDAVPPNPGLKEVREAAALARSQNVDFIVGIGGGSPLDAAKAVALLTVNDLDDDAVYSPPYSRPPLPLAAVPTTAGTGSEVTPYAILTNDKLRSKSNLSHEGLFPRLAFLDARYTQSLPRTVTVNTALDALSHLVEGYLAVRATPLSRSLALQGLALLGPGLRALAADPGLPSPTLRETLLLASTTAGMVIAHTGTTAGHALGYSLTYFRGIDHGRANALTMTEYLAYLRPTQAALVDRVLAALPVDGISGLKSLLDSLLGTKERLTEAEIETYSGIAVKARNMANTLVPPTQADLAALYRKSFESP